MRDPRKMCVWVGARVGRPDHSVAYKQLNQEMDPDADISRGCVVHCSQR